MSLPWSMDVISDSMTLGSESLKKRATMEDAKSSGGPGPDMAERKPAKHDGEDKIHDVRPLNPRRGPQNQFF